MDPIHMDTDDELPSALLAAYRDVTGDEKSESMVISGGTYAKCFKNILAFGGQFPNDENTMHQANEMGIELLDEELYKRLQQLGQFDLKTSSWIATPEEFRKLGGALFAERRYGRVFFFHNGADSYYSVRGWRGFVCL